MFFSSFNPILIIFLEMKKNHAPVLQKILSLTPHKSTEHKSQFIIIFTQVYFLEIFF
jgi:hypothetical protein